MEALVVALLALLGGDPPPAAAETSVKFRTDLAPRIDPVFGDARTLRSAVDRFLEVDAEMDKVRDEFSGAVHHALGEIARVGRAKRCPDGAAAPWKKAQAAGRRYLALGREVEARYRAVRKQDDLGDTAALTPDYRIKVRTVRETYVALLRDFREMRVAFHEQLAAEMRFAGCVALVDQDAKESGPSNPTAWKLEEDDAAAGAQAAEAEGPEPLVEVSEAPDSVKAAGAPSTPGQPGLARSVWIAIDNTRCSEPSRLSIDGVRLGEIAAGKRTSIRVRSGPHELCVLPAADPRACGSPGTSRRAYFYEGWSISVRCDATARHPDAGPD